MCRGDHDAALPRMSGDEIGGEFFPRGVERGKRFVEEPEGTAAEDEARERQAAALSGGKILPGKLAHACKAHASERFGDGAARGKERGGKRRVLRHRQLRLHSVLMAEPADEPPAFLGVGDGARAGVEFHRAAGLGKQPRENAKQGGFSGAVGAFEGENLPSREREGKIAKDGTPAALAGEGGGGYGF